MHAFPLNWLPKGQTWSRNSKLESVSINKALKSNDFFSCSLQFGAYLVKRRSGIVH